MKIAHVEASNIVPPMVSSWMPENILEQGAGNALKNVLPKNLLEEKEDQIQKIFENLNLQGVESWTEQQQQSAKALIAEYKHLFALDLNELDKTSLVST